MTLSSATVKFPDVLVAAALPAAAPPAPSPLVSLKDLNFAVATDVSVKSVQVTYSYQNNVVQTYTVEVDHGHYYIDAGLLLPIVYQGQRNVTTSSTPGSSDQVLRVQQDWAVRPALAVNVYPFGGHRRDGLCVCTASNVWSFLGDFVGFQGGIDLDLAHAVDHFYAGLILEPVMGVSVDLGAAWMRGQFLPTGFTEGMLVSPGFQPDSNLMVRFYFGVTVALGVVNSVATLSSGLRGTKFQ